MTNNKIVLEYSNTHPKVFWKIIKELREIARHYSDTEVTWREISVVNEVPKHE